MAIGSIPGLSFLKNEFAVFILSNIPIYTDRIENFGLFFLQSQNFEYFLVHLSRRLIDELMVCTGICGSLLSCESSFHISLIVSSQHKHE